MAQGGPGDLTFVLRALREIAGAKGRRHFTNRGTAYAFGTVQKRLRGNPKSSLEKGLLHVAGAAFGAPEGSFEDRETRMLRDCWRFQVAYADIMLCDRCSTSYASGSFFPDNRHPFENKIAKSHCALVV